MSASSYSIAESFDNFTCHMSAFDAALGYGTRVEVGPNESNAGTLVIEMSIINECACGVDLSADHAFVKGNEDEDGHALV